MTKKVLISGLLGGLTLVVWMFLVNGLLRFNSSMNMKQIPNESEVYEILKENITEPGRYTCNPELTPERRFPEGEPVFSILYGGVGHEAAGRNMLVGLVVFFLSSIVASWLLSLTSERILSSYPRKVFFFFLIGLLFALFNDLTNFGIGDYPLSDAFIFAIHDIIVWTVVGLVVAWRMKPESSTEAPS
jgi:hypothetical protein